MAIPLITNWSVTPQNGQVEYFTLMNTWLFESTAVISSANTSITKMNEAIEDVNNIALNAINAITFDNIAQLRLNSNIGRVDILGYYTKGDGGGGTFYWDSTSTEADNGGTIIQATGIPAGRWKRPLTGYKNVKNWGIRGDGTINDTLCFTKLETALNGEEIDLQGLSYNVDSMPIGNKYYNGSWVISAITSSARYQGAQLTGAGRISFGDGSLSSLPLTYSAGSSATIVALGYKALASATQVKKAIAIGANSQENTLISRDNISIGDSSLKNVQSRTPNYDQSQKQGTRNIAIGGNAGYFLTEGTGNTIIGRNVGQGITKDIGVTVLGSNAYAGYAPIGLSGEIENWASTLSASGTDNYTVAIGTTALGAGVTNYCVAIGGDSLTNNKKSTGNVAVGINALRYLDKNTWYNGGAYTEFTLNGTYTQVGTLLTIHATSHGFSSGDIVLFRLLDGGSETFQGDKVPSYVNTIIDNNSFTIISPKNITSSGNATIYGKATSEQNTTNNTNTAVGMLAGNNLLTGNGNSLFGYRALNTATGGANNVAIGQSTLEGLTTANNCSSVGYGSLRFMTDGSAPTGTGTNRTGIGYGARVSGDNQVQLGDSTTTTYVYGTVQNRSDLRDKADIEDTKLGLEFINKLRPVDYRWDMREDYFITNDDGSVSINEKDGSKKRKRKHHGLIAQEVKEIIEDMGVDFGGFQDHSKDGGCDVLSLGYDEFISPLIKAIQELNKKIEILEAKHV